MNRPSCHECAAPLSEGETVCALGHLVAIAPVAAASAESPVSELAELRAKVNQAFAAAESQLQVLTEMQAAPSVPEQPVPVRASVPPPPPPPPPAPQLFAPMPSPGEDRLDDPITAFAPAARLDWGPEKSKSSKASGFLKRFNR